MTNKQRLIYLFGILFLGLSLSGCSILSREKTPADVQQTFADNGWIFSVSFDEDEGTPDTLFITKDRGEKIVNGVELSNPESYRLRFFDNEIGSYYFPFSESVSDIEEREDFAETLNDESKELLQSIDASLVDELNKIGLTKDDIFVLVSWIQENATADQPLPLDIVNE